MLKKTELLESLASCFAFVEALRC